MGQTIYSTDKTAIKIFTEGLYSELKNTPVKVTVVHPGAIITNITGNSGLGKPSEASKTKQTAFFITRLVEPGLIPNRF